MSAPGRVSMAWLAPGQRRSAPEGDARPRTTELADRVREISENGCRGQPWPDWKRRRHDGRSAGPGGYCAWRSGGADQPAPRAKQQSKSDRPPRRAGGRDAGNGPNAPPTLAAGHSKTLRPSSLVVSTFPVTNCSRTQADSTAGMDRHAAKLTDRSPVRARPIPVRDSDG